MFLLLRKKSAQPLRRLDLRRRATRFLLFDIPSRGAGIPAGKKNTAGAHNRIYACVPLVVFPLYRFPFPFAKVIFHKKPVQNGG
jgi:hypothetical protein